MRIQFIKKSEKVDFNKYSQPQKFLPEKLLWPPISPSFTRRYNNQKLTPILILSIIIIFAITLIFFSNRGIIGYITLQKEYSLNYTINKEFTENSEYMSNLINGNLKSVRLSGKISNGTIARVYIENDGKKYLILNITKITDYKSPSITGSIITGLVIAEEVTNNVDNIANQTIIINETIITNTSVNTTINQSISKRITINLSYKGETTYDTDNNGIEPITNVIDLTVENSTFNWLVNSSKLCTLWEVYSTGSENKTAICHGSSECCSLKGVLPTRNLWNEPLYLSYGLYGSGYKNIISSKIIHLEKDEIIESSSANLSADFIDEKLLSFENICIDTCILFGFNKSSYKLIIEVEKGKIVLDYLNYIVRQLIYNTPPILVSNFSNFTVVYGDTLRINLSDYFNDSDGDLLSYNFYNNNKYYANITDEIVEITPNTTGAIYTYFIANDSASISLSNIFVIDVTTMNISQDVEPITQLSAEINKPVSWIKNVEGNETKIDIPNNAFNISVERIINNKRALIESEKISIIENGSLVPLIDYEIEKKIKRLEKRVKEEKSKDTNMTKVKELEDELNKVSPKISLSDDSKEDTDKKKEKKKTNERIVNETITEVLINDTADEFNVIYSTEPPVVYEIQTNTNTKVITISSDIPYTNVLAYTTINDYPQNSIRLYWVRNDTRELFSNLSYYDINNNTLIDKIGWVVPHLSNQTFEVSIIILNVQSYPTVGGNWTVRFNTTDTGNLTIGPSNGTTYAEIPDNDSTVSDLVYLETRCDDVIFNTTIVCSNDVKMPYEAYRMKSRIADIKKRLVELNQTG